MAQTTQYGIIVNPTGHRMLLQAGNHAFTLRIRSVTLTTKLRRLVAAHCRPIQAPATKSKTASVGGVYPWVSVTQFTVNGLTKGSIIVSRKTAGLSVGAQFSYMLIGY